MNLFQTIDNNPDSSGLVAVLLIVLVFSYLYFMDRKIKLTTFIKAVFTKIELWFYVVLVILFATGIYYLGEAFLKVN